MMVRKRGMGWRTVAVALVVAGLVGSCSRMPGTPPGAGAAADGVEPLVGRTALGAFVAARAAQLRGDSRAAAEYYLTALKYDPENAEILQRSFTLLVAEGRVNQALALSDRALRFDPDASIPLMALGLTAARQGRFSEAEAKFNQIPRRGIFSFLVPLLTAWCQAGQDQPIQALERLAPLAQTSGLDQVRAYHSALINDLAGRNAAAEDAYHIALDGPLAVRTSEAAAAFYLRTGRPEMARTLYLRYLGEHPDTVLLDVNSLSKKRPVPDAQTGMAEALFDVASVMRQGQANDLALVFARLALYIQPDFPLTQLMVGDLLSAQGRGRDAVVAYRAIPSAAPASQLARLRVALNLNELGDKVGAFAELDRLAQLQPTNIDPLMTKGDILRHDKKYADAATAYGQAIARLGAKPQSHHWSAFYSRGIAFERSGQWAKAEADFKKALILAPDQPDVLNYLGYSWVDQGLHLQDARAMIEKAVVLRPRDGAIVDSLGWALFRMGDFAGAAKVLERAADLRPEDPTINEHLGDALFKVGRVDEAGFHWRRAMGLDPEPEQIDGLKRKIETGVLPDGAPVIRP